MAADFVADVLNGRLAKPALVDVDRQAEFVKTRENSAEVLCMINSHLTCLQHIIDVDENEIEVSEDGVYKTLESPTSIP